MVGGDGTETRNTENKSVLQLSLELVQLCSRAQASKRRTGSTLWGERSVQRESQRTETLSSTKLCSGGQHRRIPSAAWFLPHLYITFTRGHNQGYVGKYLTTSFLGDSEREALVCSICQFPLCKFFYCCSFRAISLITLNAQFRTMSSISSHDLPT